MPARPTYSSTFVLEVDRLDDDFYRIDTEIAQRARMSPGLLGEDAWHNEGTVLRPTRGLDHSSDQEQR